MAINDNKTKIIELLIQYGAKHADQLKETNA